MSGLIYKDLVREVASNKPASSATAFNLPDSATAPARSFDNALATGSVVMCNATNGTDWQTFIGTFTAGAPDTISQDSLIDSSTGSFIDFSAGSDVTLRLVWAAQTAYEVDLALRGLIPGGRLTFSVGNPDYNPTNTIAVSGQDTGADTITVTAHGWTVGTMIKSSATSGGITAGTQYYAGNITTNTISLHTTVADALAGTSKLNITGTVTANISANGVSNTDIIYEPYIHNIISLWNGYRWQSIEFTATTLAIGTVTSGLPYDIFAYSNSGVLAIESLAWSTATARATDVTRQDGRLCKSGDKTRLYLGTFLPDSTTTSRNSNNYLGLVNQYNKIPFTMMVWDETATWTYSTAVIRQVNGSSFNQVDFVLPFSDYSVNIMSAARCVNSTTTVRYVITGWAIDSTTSLTTELGGQVIAIYPDNTRKPQSNMTHTTTKIPIGKHYIAAVEYGNGTDTQTWSGGYEGYQRLAATIGS